MAARGRSDLFPKMRPSKRVLVVENSIKCISRRLILHEKVYDRVLEGLKKAYASISKRIGDPLDDGTLYGPMHSRAGIEGYKVLMSIETDIEFFFSSDD